MNRIYLLLTTGAYNYFSLNEIRHPKEGKNSSRLVVGICILMILLCLCGYNVVTAYTLSEMNQQDLIPPYMVAVSSFIILIYTILQSNGILFASKDFDMLSALPVKANEIISSKFLFMYVLNFLISCLFMLPGGIIWMIKTLPDMISIMLYMVSIFLVPFLPMCISCFIGVGIAALSSLFQNKNIISLFLSFAALGIIGYIGATSIKSQPNTSEIEVILAGQISSLYPFSYCFLSHKGLPILPNLAFIIGSLLLSFVFVTITGRHYAKINSFVIQCNSITLVRKQSLKKRSPFMAMYCKEARRLISSSMYLLNTGFGVVTLIVMSILFCFIPMASMSKYTGIENFATFLKQLSPVMIAAMLSISCPAASSISLEGKNLWILQSAPLSMKTFLNSKIAVNLSLHGIGYTIAVLVFSVRLAFELLPFVTLLVVPVAYSFFTVVQGIYINCLFPNFYWENEIVAVKQSIASILSGLIGMMSIALPVLLYWFFHLPLLPLLWITSIILIIVAVLLYLKAVKIQIV